MIGNSLKRTGARFRLGLVVAVTLFSTVATTFGDIGTSEAWGGKCAGGGAQNVAYNTWRWCGYFQNKVDTFGQFVFAGGIPGGIGNGIGNDAQEFIDFIGTGLGSGQQYRTGSQFIILTMQGYNGGVSKAQAGADFGAWAAKVLQWQTQGRIDWHSNYWLPQNAVNTYYQDSVAGGDDAFFYEQDPAIYNHWHDTIIICNIACGAPGAFVQYRIRRLCGNPLGTITPPTQSNYDIALSAAALTSENGASPYQVVAGTTYSLQAVVHNNGPATSDPGTLQVQWPGAMVCSPSAPCPLSQTQIPAGGATSRGFRAASGIGGTAGPGPNWYWITPAFGSGGGVTAQMQFTPVGAVGTTFNMDVYYTPMNLSNGIGHVVLSYRIVSKRVPGISGTNSDIHAGGGTCGLPLTAGNVTTSPSGVSVGQYVVSASGSINSIFSNNANTAANDKLKVGNAGAYAQVCRQDLWTAASKGWPSGPGIHTIGGAGVVSYPLTGNEEGVYYFNGTRLILHGAVGNPVAAGPPPVAPLPVTIVTLKPGAVVEIDGNITLNNTSYSSHTVPSLGVISSGDIWIDPAVTRVDAYLFSSQGTIVTCNGTVAACNTPQLVVNGFLMGKGLLFGRVGALDTNGTPITEAIVLNPQIYLNPPKYFDASVDDTLLLGQGEKAPLF